MHFKAFALAGLASIAAAQQSQSLAEALNSTSDLSALNGVITQFNLAGALSGLNNVTLLAPNNAAISAFLNQTAASGITPTADLVAAILQYHVIVNGSYQNFSASPHFNATALTNSQFTNVTGGQRVEISNNTVYSGLRANSSIMGSPVNFTGGVIHVIDRVLTVPESIGQTAIAFNLTSFYGALNATGLLATLNGASDVTVFVPNNAAFRSIGSALPNLTMEQSVAILGYHVVNGTVAYSTLLSNDSQVPTMEGGNVTVTIHNSSAVFVNNARVVIPDILVGNGVVHVIDEVLNPANTTAAAATATAGQPAFSGASSATNEPFTSGQPTPTSSINTGVIASSATARGSSSSSTGAAWVPRPTGAIGAAAIGGLALLMQL